MSDGIKEEQGKLNYEINWEFIENVAKRMSINKGKYPPYNWKQKIDVEKLKQAMTRHFVEIMKGEYSDEQEMGHLYAIVCNAMMIEWQIKNFKD